MLNLLIFNRHRDKKSSISTYFVDNKLTDHFAYEDEHIKTLRKTINFMNDSFYSSSTPINIQTQLNNTTEINILNDNSIKHDNNKLLNFLNNKNNITNNTKNGFPYQNTFKSMREFNSIVNKTKYKINYIHSNGHIKIPKLIPVNDKNKAKNGLSHYKENKTSKAEETNRLKKQLLLRSIETENVSQRESQRISQSKRDEKIKIID